MSDDLVERLQAVRRDTGRMTAVQDGPNGPWVHRAVYETDPICAEAAAALIEARAEIARLEGALMAIVGKDSYIDASIRSGTTDRVVEYGDFARIARAALAPRDAKQGDA